jgi:hypothetical protein
MSALQPERPKAHPWLGTNLVWFFAGFPTDMLILWWMGMAGCICFLFLSAYSNYRLTVISAYFCGRDVALHEAAGWHSLASVDSDAKCRAAIWATNQ